MADPEPEPDVDWVPRTVAEQPKSGLAIWDALVGHGPLCVDRIIDETGRSSATVYRRLEELREAGLIEQRHRIPTDMRKGVEKRWAAAVDEGGSE